jgi:hypothetical protein
MACFEYSNIHVEVTRQVQRGGKPGVTPTDDGDIAAVRTLQGFPGEAGLACRGFPVRRLGLVELVEAGMKKRFH